MRKFNIDIKTITALLSCLFVTITLPALTIWVISAEAGMLVCMILFFAVNPIFSVALGIFSGRNIEKRWYLPVFFAVAFLICTILIFETIDIAFFIYMLAYLILGAGAMLITKAARRKTHKH